MNRIVEQIVSWLLDYYLAATGLLLLGMAARRLMRQPARRMAVAWGVFTSLMLAALLVSAPEWPRWQIGLFAPQTGESPAPLSEGTLGALEPADAADRPRGEPIVLIEPAQPRRDAREAAIAPPGERANAPAAPLRWPSLAVIFYGAGLAAMVLRLAAGLIGMSALRRKGSAPPPHVDEESARISGPLRRPVPIRMNDGIASPIATGALSPQILLPSEFGQPEQVGELRVALAHEWAHIRNGDLWLLAIDRFLSVVLWMHPLYWVLRRRIRDDQEYLADASASAIAGAADYAAMLVAWARRALPARRSILAESVGLWERPSRLESRVRTVLNADSPIEPRCPARWRLAAVFLLCAAGMALTVVSTRTSADEGQPAVGKVASLLLPEGVAEAKQTAGPATEMERKLYGTWNWSSFLLSGTITYSPDGKYRYEYTNQPEATRTGRWRIENGVELVYEGSEKDKEVPAETRWRIAKVSHTELTLMPQPQLSLKTVTYTRTREMADAARQQNSKEKGQENKESKKGDNLLKRIREASEPILAEMAEKHGYGLAPEQMLRRIAPPFDPIRMKYYRTGHPTQSEYMPGGPSAIVFRWNENRLQNWSMTFGSEKDEGYSLAGLLDALKQIKRQHLRGPDDLLRKTIPGDWSVRVGVSDEVLVAQLQSILQKELGLPIRLEFRMIDQEVYVARGEYRFQPLAGQPKEDKTYYETETVVSDPVQIFGKQIIPNSGAGGGTGEFAEFLEWLGAWVEAPIVDEATRRPSRRLSWLLHGESGTQLSRRDQHDPSLVLPNIEAQTGLKFSKETRRVKTLFVEPVQLPQPQPATPEKPIGR